MFTLFNKKKPENEIYFALSLYENGGVGYLFQCNSQFKSVIILESKQFTFSNAWEGILEDVDEVLYSLETNQKVKASKAIVFIYSHLVDLESKTIKEPYLSKIKSVFSEIDLKVTGFIEYHESIANHLSETSGPLNAILCEVDEHVITVIIYRNGKVEKGQIIPKTSDFLENIEKVLKTSAQTITLPLHVLFYGNSDVSTVVEQFVSHKWGQDIFVQFPKVESLTRDFVENTFLTGFKSQLFERPDIDTSEVPIVPPKMEVVTEANDESVTQSDLSGFIIGQDILDTKQEEKKSDEKNSSVKPTPVIPIQKAVLDPFEFAQSHSNNKKNNLPSLGNMFANKNKIIGFAIFISGLLLVLGSLYLLLFRFHKAKITLFFNSNPITKELAISGNTLQLQKKTKIITKSEKTATTGKKFIGTHATGEVSILNKAKKSVTISKNTKLTGPKGYIFVLDKDIKIASSSEQLTSDGNYLTVTGKEKAGVTAEEIGEERNIPKGSVLSFDGISDVTVTALSAFSGGTKKEIRTVSKTDLDTLRKKIKESSKKELNSEITKDGTLSLINVLTTIAIQSESFSKEVAEESDTVSITAKMNVQYYMLNQKETKKKLAELLSKSIPSKFILDSNNISYTIKNAKTDKNGISLILRVKGLPRQKVDVDNIKSDYIGVSTNDAQSIANKYNAIKAEYFIDTPLPILESRFPFFKSNILLFIKTL